MKVVFTNNLSKRDIIKKEIVNNIYEFFKTHEKNPSEENINKCADFILSNFWVNRKRTGRIFLKKAI